jgi:predicted phage terminase large subunit-like protein
MAAVTRARRRPAKVAPKQRSPEEQAKIDRQVLLAECRRDFGMFVRVVFHAIEGKKFRYCEAVHGPVFEAFNRMFKGECTKLIINMPPRTAKTTLAQYAIAFGFGLNPRALNIYAAYGLDLSEAKSAEVRNIVMSAVFREIFPGIDLDEATKAKGDWRTVQGGQVFAVGVGSAVLGWGCGRQLPDDGKYVWAGGLFMDDMSKAQDELQSADRQKMLTFYHKQLKSRRNDRLHTPQVVIQQRTHIDDLPGHLLAGGDGDAAGWEHIKIQALITDPETGEESSIFEYQLPLSVLLAERIADPVTFSGQYQQEPVPAEGVQFKADKIRVIDALPDDARAYDWVRGWDTAGTIGNRSDFSVGVLIGRHRAREDYIIRDAVRFKALPDTVLERMLSTAIRDGRDVKLSYPTNPNDGGLFQANVFAKKFAGRNVVFETSHDLGSKGQRAAAFAAAVNAGLVSMMRGDWNGAMKQEMHEFPLGKHDDIIDAASRAFTSLNVPDPSAETMRVWGSKWADAPAAVGLDPDAALDIALAEVRNRIHVTLTDRQIEARVYATEVPTPEPGDLAIPPCPGVTAWGYSIAPGERLPVLGDDADPNDPPPPGLRYANGIWVIDTRPVYVRDKLGGQRQMTSIERDRLVLAQYLFDLGRIPIDQYFLSSEVQNEVRALWPTNSN